MTTSITLNGRETTVDTTPDTPLLWVLRDHLNLTGTKFGCGVAACGACTVLVDGVATRSCVTPVSTVDGANVTTIEGLEGREAEVVQAAWQEIDVPQCGYCQSGQIVSAVALLRENPAPTAEEIDDAMDGNVCRCATYQRIKQAISNAATNL